MSERNAGNRRTGRVRAFCGCSLDGYIAGPNDDIDWLTEDYAYLGGPQPSADALNFEEFMPQVGAMLMGRKTYDVVEGMGIWPYGELPILVATTRPIEPMLSTVVPVVGGIEELVEKAKSTAGGRDVYVDGGTLVTQAIEAGVLDELTLTIVPMLIGEGTSLFGRLEHRVPVRIEHGVPYTGGAHQLRIRFTDG